MKAITVQQPWAWAIIHGGKNIENRTRIGTWRAAAGQRIGIHAGARWSYRGQATLARAAALGHLDGQPPLGRDGYPTAALIGTVEVVDVHPDSSCCVPWGESSYLEHGGRRRVEIVHLVLEQPRPVDPPVPMTGRLGLWTVNDPEGER